MKANYSVQWELMKVIWANGGTTLYAEIVAAFSEKGMA